MLHPLIKHRLSGVRTRSQAMQVWSDHQDELRGYTFVLSEQQGEGILRFPPKLDFPEGGHLRSIFPYENLYVINHDLVDRMFTVGSAQIAIDYTVAFDANVASYMRAWHKGHSVTIVSMLQAVFKQLGYGKFNWDLIPFLLERGADIMANRDLDKIYETQLACDWFGACDRKLFEKTGEIKLLISERELALQSQSALANWHRILKNGVINVINQRFATFYSVILKTVLLQIENPSPDATAIKLKRLLEFMDEELNGIFMLAIRAALEFFKKGGAFKPMSKVASLSPNIIQNARNVTWDFVQVIWRQTFTGFHGRHKGLLIPYFLTFDNGLAELLDLFPQRSCIFGNEIDFPLFFLEMDLLALIVKPYPELEPVVGRIFTIEAANVRDERRKQQTPSVTTIAENLEKRLNEILDMR